MKVRPRGKRVLTNRKPQTVGGGWCRLVVVLIAAGILFWVLASRSDSFSDTSAEPEKKGEHGLLRGMGLFKSVNGTWTSLTMRKSKFSDEDSSVASVSESVSYGHLKPGENGNFKVRPQAVKTHTLRQKISRDNLQRVYLDHHRFGQEGELSEGKDGASCTGSPCPDFDYCYKGFEGIGACVKPSIEDTKRVPSQYPANCPNLEINCVQEPDFQPHEKWTPQVFVLHNVYINVAGQIFNSSHFFDTNACTSEQPFIHVPGKTQITAFAELVSMVDWFGWNARSNMLDLVPMLVTLDAVMPALKGIPIAYGHRMAHRRTQLEQMQAIGLEDILGMELDDWNPQILQGPHLFFAEKLFVPLHQRCGRPSRSLWKHIRYNHFLAREGLPLYTPDWIPRKVQPASEPFEIPDDWVVLLGMKKTIKNEREPLLETLKLVSHMEQIFGKDRVEVYYEGRMPMPRRKELLNRARLLVAVHENVLADMVYMPPGGHILEIRPRDDPDPTFHHLAEVCELQYYLTFCDGKKGDPKHASNLRVKNPRPIYDALKEIAKKLKAA